MDKTPKISVIMCTYNRKKFLECSIESVLNQTFEEFEFILINNGSTDGSKSICEKYAQKDKRIKLINIEINKGASNGRNNGIDVAEGEFITIIDDDDYCEPQMLEFLWSLITQYDADISICGSWSSYNGKKEAKFISNEILILDKVGGLDELLKREIYNVSPPTKLFRRSLFKDLRFPSDVIVDDIHIIYKVFVEANKVIFHGKPLYTFVRHGDNMTKNIEANDLYPELLEEYIEMYSARIKYLAKKVPELTERARYSEWSYMISMCSKIIKYDCLNCMEIYKMMISFIKGNYKEFINSEFITIRDIYLLKEISEVEDLY